MSLFFTPCKEKKAERTERKRKERRKKTADISVGHLFYLLKYSFGTDFIFV